MRAASPTSERAGSLTLREILAIAGRFRPRDCSIRLLLGIVGSSLCGCAVVPPLEQATGTNKSNILVADIVKRVKCELADSFDRKTEDPRFLWLQDWTVKTDLTLQINDQAGVSPSASYTKYAKNAFNYGAGTQSLTANTIGFVQQFFTLAAGANYSEQAVRTEVVSFSLALKELKVWREQVRRQEERDDFPAEQRVCNPRVPVGTGGRPGAAGVG